MKVGLAPEKAAEAGAPRVRTAESQTTFVNGPDIGPNSYLRQRHIAGERIYVIELLEELNPHIKLESRVAH